ncbi:PREDICTED: protein LONGIFOLIA 1-like [Nicotiana attenuata]|uniref:Protein longifolia 1 n=1 Tax=Nicotiana attenuata TaxID=49451 RepID=A0A314KLZ4_NICAT|nr:PREDICTED: protein LONGIFOLIA 1-like [Nicotiana attenuata]OIT30481.1 protein longifolia 1 [Nicotiana attenuata]
MSGRIVSSENFQVQKQIGCINGFFQLFDRHHFQSHKRLLFSGAMNDMAAKYATEIEIEAITARELPSNETSKASSCSFLSPSTSSTLQDNKRVQRAPLCHSLSNLSESPSQILPAKRSSLSHSGRHSPDLRDVVKDSMYRDARSLSVKTVAKVEGRVHVMKHRDSPRPLQHSNYGKASSGTARGPAKLCEAHWNAGEDKVGFLQRAPKDCPRFSCDGRESTETMQSMMKLKGLPRLSLDSRQQSLRRSAYESRSNFLLGDQELQCRNRSSSVVAKLMGLEAFPNYVPSNDIEIVTSHANDLSKRSAGKSKINQVTMSPQNLEEDFSTPRMKSTNPITRTAASTKSAPRRQPEANRTSQKSSVRCKGMEASPQSVEGSPLSPHLSFSAYGKIEKRITKLEFRRSGMDLRALKQTLEAMQKIREKLEGQRALRASDAESVQQGQQRSPLSLTTKVTHLPKRLETSNLTPKPAKPSDKIKFASSAAPTANISKLQEVYTQDLVYNRDDIVDKKTSKGMTPRANNVAGSGWHLTSPDKKIGRTSKAVQTTSRQRREGTFNPALGKSYGTLSPRLQKKQEGMDKQACQTIQSSETSKVRRQSIKQIRESGSSKRNQKVKPSNMKQADDLNEISNYKRNFSEHSGAVSVLSEIDNSLASHAKTESSTNCSFQIDAKRQEDNKERGDTLRLSEDAPTNELAIVTVEQLSPVSVLDTIVYVEDSPSPVKKKIVTAFRDDGFAVPDVWYRDDLDHSPYRTRLDLGVESNHKILESKDELVHELRKPNSTIHKANMDQLASLCQNHNPDHRYISKILLASGLLKDVDSMSTTIQLHSPSHLINPKLFDVVEQTEESSLLATEEHSEEIAQIKFDHKTRRKIIFDTINEILVRKLGSDNNLMQNKCWNATQILKELKSEIDHFNSKRDASMDSKDDELISILDKDMMHQSEDWTNHHNEIPVLVLDVERLIFKDLIKEIIGDETTEQHKTPRQHCR